MSADQTWNYIQSHQDDSKCTIAYDLNISYDKANDLIFAWAWGDREHFNKSFISNA